VRIAEVADHPYTLYFGLRGLGLAHLRRGDLPPRDPGPRAGAISSAERGRSSRGHRSSPRPSAPPTPSPAGLTRRSRWSRAPSRSSAVARFTPAGAHSSVRGDDLPLGRADRRGRQPRPRGTGAHPPAGSSGKRGPRPLPRR
jgi:hypothetical protein